MRPIMSGNRLYNILFPIMLGSSILFLIVMIFMTPVEQAIDIASKGMNMNKIRQTEKTLGTASVFGLKDPRNLGALSVRPA